MASIKVKFRPSTIADREGTIYYRIIHERKVRQLLSYYREFSYESCSYRPHCRSYIHSSTVAHNAEDICII